MARRKLFDRPVDKEMVERAKQVCREYTVAKQELPIRAMWSSTRAPEVARPFVQHGSWGATATDLRCPEIFTRKQMSRCSERRPLDEHKTE